MTRRPVFVFGSNEAGRHGKGAALTAVRDYGAIYGRASGPQGSAYGIPTKDKNLKTLPLAAIAVYVRRFLQYARAHEFEVFYVTAIGTGLAGYTADDIAPMFYGYPENCLMPDEFRAVISTMTEPVYPLDTE